MAFKTRSLEATPSPRSVGADGAETISANGFLNTLPRTVFSGGKGIETEGSILMCAASANYKNATVAAEGKGVKHDDEVCTRQPSCPAAPTQNGGTGSSLSDFINPDHVSLKYHA